MMRFYRFRFGFSLIEILVVLSVLSILLVLIFLAAGKVRQSAYSVACKTNLRIVAQAGKEFLEDHDGVFHSRNLEHPSTNPPGTRGLSDYLGFDRVIYSDTVYSCPAEQAGEFPSEYYYHRTNGVNEWLIDYPGKVDKETGLNYAPRITDFPQQMMTAYIMDGTINTDYVSQGTGYRYFNHLNQGSIDRNMRFPHNDKINVVFLDTHVESFTKESIPKQKFSYFWWGDVVDSNRYRR